MSLSSFVRKEKTVRLLPGRFFVLLLLPIYKTLPSVRRTMYPPHRPKQLVIHIGLVYYFCVLNKYLCRNRRIDGLLGVLEPFFGSKRGLQSCNFCLLAQNFRKNMHLDFEMVKLLGFGI